jgi:hypothetical protein
MSDEKDSNQHCCKRGRGMCHGSIYGLGVLGAAVYFIQNSNGFWMGVLGVLKAIVWPAVLVYKALELMKM